MRKLVVILVGLVLVYVLLDIGSRLFVEGRVESEFETAEEIEVEAASFSIDSLPFLARLGLFAEVSATLRLDGVQDRGVTVDQFELEVDGLVFDRDRAFRGDVLVSDLDRATATVRFEQQTVTDLLGVEVRFGEGTATASGVSVQAQLSGGALVVGAEGVGSVTLPVPLDRYLPCDPAVAFEPGVVELTCTTRTVPPIVNQAIGEATNRQD